jgi:hypothetical protein
LSFNHLENPGNENQEKKRPEKPKNQEIIGAVRINTFSEKEEKIEKEVTETPQKDISKKTSLNKKEDKPAKGTSLVTEETRDSNTKKTVQKDIKATSSPDKKQKESASNPELKSEEKTDKKEEKTVEREEFSTKSSPSSPDQNQRGYGKTIRVKRLETKKNKGG